MLFLSSIWANARQHAAIALTVLFVAAQFSAGLHLAVVEHETCEHGDTVHGKHLGPSGAPKAQASLVSTVATDQNAPDEGETHDHCDVSLLENATFELHALVSVEHPALSSVHVEPVVTLGQAWWSAHPQFRIAPKQSPPLSAV